MVFSQICGWTADMWGPVIGLFGFIQNWGWMIIVFTICLKLILSPLDYWQKKVARDSARKQAVLQPELIKLRKKFGNNKQMLNQKTMELYKRENFNMSGSCISMLVNMAITLFIFITLFYGLMGISQIEIAKQYDKLQETYNQEFSTAYGLTGEDLNTQIKEKENQIWQSAYENAKTELGITGEVPKEKEVELYNKALEFYANTQINGTEMKISDIQAKVLDKYNTEIKQSWLWVSNIWRPDTNASGFPNYSTFTGAANFYGSAEYKEAVDAKLASLPEGATDEQKSIAIKEVQNEFENKYNFVTYNVQSAYQSWNGYFILVILAAVITYLSAVVSQMQTSKKDKTQTQTEGEIVPAKSMKFMKFLLPILMIIFTIGYSAVFALYIVTNSLMTTIISFIFLKIFEKQEKKKKITITTKNKPDYSR